MTVFVNTILKRLLGFASIGLLVFPLELLLAALLIEVFNVPYLWAITVSFFIAVSLAYKYYRKYSFYNSSQGQWRGYLYFILLALIGLGIALVGSYWLVTYVAIHPIIARGFMGIVTGLCNFSINLIYNFKVAGK